MPIYNKLIRDKVPDYIKKDKKEFRTRVLSDKEFHEALISKVNEELKEYNESESSDEAIEELADLLQLIHELAAINSISMDEIEKIRIYKKKKRGAFSKKLFLIDVED